MGNTIEDHFQALWVRAKGGDAAPLSTATIEAWAQARGMIVAGVEERRVGPFRPIPAIVLEAEGAKACFPLISEASPEWQAHRAAADRAAELWKQVEWFSPLWISNAKATDLMSAIRHRSGAEALQEFDYHLSTVYTLAFEAICIAQLLPKTRSLAVFAPLVREAYLAFYSGHRASSVAALIPVIEGGIQRIASAKPGLNPVDAITHTVDRVCQLAADAYFEHMWVPEGYRSVQFLFGQDERIFVFETFRRWLKDCFFQPLKHYSGATSLNRHLFAHGKSVDWQQPSNFSRLLVAITTLGVIEAWHDQTNVVPLMLPSMDQDARLLWQQALLRGQLQIALNLHEQADFHAHGRLVPELPTDDGVTLRQAVLMEDAINDLVRPLRDAGWSVHLGKPDAQALHVIATATSRERRLSVALLYSCASSNDLYRDLASKVDAILYRGAPYHQDSFAAGISIHVGPVAGWQPPRPPDACAPAQGA